MRRTIGTVLCTGLENLLLRQSRVFGDIEVLEYLRRGEQVRLLHCRARGFLRKNERCSTRHLVESSVKEGSCFLPEQIHEGQVAG